MTVPLNLPKTVSQKENQFAIVSFVNSMSHYSLKVLVKRLWENLFKFANVFDGRRKDVSNILDHILSGEKWSENDIRTRYVFYIHKGEIIQYDSLENKFKTLYVLNNKWNIANETDALTYDDLVKKLKEV